MEKTSPSLMASASWIGSSQIVMRVARILSTIVVARMIAPELLGIAAITLAINEIAHVLVRNATNGKIIQADENELDTLCNTAYTFNWIVGLIVLIFQIILGYFMSLVYSDVSIFYLVSVLGISYILLPIAQVHAALNLRREKIGLIAKTEMQQTWLDAAVTVSMVLLGCGIWSLILPKLIVVPVWIRAHKNACDWNAPDHLMLTMLVDHLTFNSRVLGVELLGVLRHNIDYVLVGYFLGMHALGIYYFAFNAGLGITRGFILSLNNAFYPYLCSVKHDCELIKHRFRLGLRYMLILITPLLALQALLAEYYVPILFGEQWIERNAAQLVSLICLGGVPLLVIEAGSKYIRANGKPAADLVWHSIYTICFVCAIAIGVQWGLLGVVVAGLIIQFIAAPIHLSFVIKSRNKKIEIKELSVFEESIS